MIHLRFASVAIAALALFALNAASYAAEPELVVHEWGTFTSLQDPTGRALGAINQDTEALPDFVQNLDPGNASGKGVSLSPRVIMRLETPVAYFHLPPNARPITLDFSAEFHGGLLTQFYPSASSIKAVQDIEKLAINTVGSAEWKNVTIGTGKPGPGTSSHVWLAPRKVDAADITAANGQSERYIFYRGVAALGSPVVVTRHDSTLNISRALGDSFATAKELAINELWYLDVRRSGEMAYRKVPATSEPGIGPVATTPADFEDKDYSAESLVALKADMQKSLVSAGLFEDEAAAMLETWDQAYFQSPGARVLFVTPRAWTDFYLPIKISVPAKIARVMVGRVDLVTPQQLAMAQQYDQQVRQLKASGPNVILPQAPQLGRFTNAIIADVQARNAGEK